MAEKTDDLVIGVSTDLSSVQRALKKLDGDISRAGSQIEKRFSAIGKGIDKAFPTSIQNRINKAVGVPTEATKEWTGALAQQGKELERLRAKFNPVFATITNYKTAIGEIRTAQRLGAISADEMANAIQRERQAALQSIAAIKQRNAVIADTPGVFGGGGAFATANIAAQFQDIGVTAAMGMSPLQIALQQGTQLSAVLNTMGGTKGAIAGLAGAFMSIVNPVSLVTIGVVAATAAAVQYGASVFGATEETEEALRRQAELVQGVANKWGDALPQVKAYADELERAKDLEDAQGASAARIDAAYREAQASLTSFLQALAEADFGAFNDSANEANDNVAKLDIALADLAEAQKAGKGTGEQFERVLRIISDLTNSSAIPTTGRLRDTVNDLADAYRAAADEAQRTADNQARLAGRGGVGISEFGGGRGSDPRSLETDPYWRKRFFPDPESPAKRARGSRGMSDAEKEKKAIDDVIASLKFEQEQLSRTAVEQRTYNELKQAGVDLNTKAGQQIATLVAQIEAERLTNDANSKAIEAQTAAFTNLFQTGTDALTSIVDGSVKAEDALKKLIVQLALAALQAKLLGTGPLAGLFGGFNPTSDGFASMLGIPKYANGTNNHPGGLALIGERGPELLNLPRGSQVLPRVPKAMGGGGGRPAEVRVLVETNDPMFTARVTTISRGQAQSVTSRGLAAYDKGKQRQQMTSG